MAPGPTNGDIFHGSRRQTYLIGSSRSWFNAPASSSVCAGAAIGSKRTFPMVPGRRLVANQIALDEAQANTRLFPQLNKPKRRFSWFKSDISHG